MKTFASSVIIPVYNAEKFLPNAVLSCVNLQAVQEVILVEDHSPGNDWQVCIQLEKEFEKVKIFRTAKNSGASVARNLGIRYATAEFISFLDADDEYLPNRFSGISNYEGSSPDAFFGSIATMFTHDDYKRKYFDKGFYEITGLKNFRANMNILQALCGFEKGVSGHLHLNAITFKKTSFPSEGFNPKLRLHQDTELIYRAAKDKLWVSLGADPIAKRRIHSENRITSANNNCVSKLRLFTVLLSQSRSKKFSNKINHYFVTRWIVCYKQCVGKLLKMRCLFDVLLGNFSLLGNRYFLSKLIRK